VFHWLLPANIKLRQLRPKLEVTAPLVEAVLDGVAK